MARSSRSSDAAHDVGKGVSDDELKLSDDELEQIGNRVREARQIKKMSQTALASSVGVGQDYLSRIESGKRQLSLAILLRIAKELGQPVGWLANDEGPGPVARAPVEWDQRDQRRKRDTRSK